MKNLMFVMEGKTKKNTIRFAIEGDTTNEIIDDFFSKVYDLKIIVDDEQITELTDSIINIVAKDNAEYYTHINQEEQTNFQIITRH